MAKKSPDRREYRHRRRVRNQVLAYLVLLVILAAIALLVIFGIKLLKEGSKSRAADDTAVAEATPSATPTPEEEQATISTPESMEELLDPTPTEAEPEEPAVDPEVQALLDGMDLESKVENLFLISPEALAGVKNDWATVAGGKTEEGIGEYHVFGVAYTEKNVVDGEKFKNMISQTKKWYFEKYERDLFAFVYEEGAYNTISSKVQGVDPQKSAQEIGESGNNENARQAYSDIGALLTEYGIDGDLAPVASVKASDQCYLGKRCFSDDADMAASMLAEAVEGLHLSGVHACLTGFPGEGFSNTDPEKGALKTERSLEEMRDFELKPFTESKADMIMVSNLVAESIDSGVSASISEKVVSGLLRDELQFEGVIVTAPLEQAACTARQTPGDWALRAVLAGADVLYVRDRDDFVQARDTLIAEVQAGTISEERIDESLIRIFSMELNK